MYMKNNRFSRKERFNDIKKLKEAHRQLTSLPMLSQNKSFSKILSLFNKTIDEVEFTHIKYCKYLELKETIIHKKLY